jgi:hypothetical protein
MQLLIEPMFNTSEGLLSSPVLLGGINVVCGHDCFYGKGK